MNGFTTFEHNRSDMKWPFSRIQRKAFEITILRSLIFQVDLSPISDSITQKVCTGGEHTYTYVYITCIYIYMNSLYWLEVLPWSLHSYIYSLYICMFNSTVKIIQLELDILCFIDASEFLRSASVSPTGYRLARFLLGEVWGAFWRRSGRDHGLETQRVGSKWCSIRLRILDLI